MINSMKISDDSYAILLVCSGLALKDSTSDVKAYTVSQWSGLADKLVQNELTPKALFDVSSESIRKSLLLSDEETVRIEKLLSRAGQLGIELSALSEKGIFTLTRIDPEYPEALKSKSKRMAPPVLFYSGNLSLLSNKGVAIVGSRNIDEAAQTFTEKLSKRCTSDGVNIVSGGARGVDSIAESAATRLEGTTVIFVSDNLEKKIRQKETREAIMRMQSLILSSYKPDMPFQAYTAMERNKYIYALSDFVVVVSSDLQKGGTWAGAIENLRHGWTPMFVRNDINIPDGNVRLLGNKDVHPITEDALSIENLNIYEWFVSQAKKADEIFKPQQVSLFDL